MIKVSCDNNSTSTLLYLLHNSEGTVVMWEEPMYTISTPSDQAKFLCMLQEEVVQVHYVMIKGVMMSLWYLMILVFLFK